MDINGILSELREERERIEEAILTLERLVRTEGKRRGRPPKWMAELQGGESNEGAADETATAGKRRRRFSPEARKRMAEAQKKRWAAAREKQEGE